MDYYLLCRECGKEELIAVNCNIYTAIGFVMKKSHNVMQCSECRSKLVELQQNMTMRGLGVG